MTVPALTDHVATAATASAVIYAVPTASMQVDPEARHLGDAASVSSAGSFPLASARCATYPTDLEWVPDRERPVVPDLVAALCRRCPGRQECLLWALAGREQGYWAGTTTADRAQLLERAESTVGAADQAQERARRRVEQSAGRPLHPAGEGSCGWYRNRGCRCTQCRAANSARRADERARARARAGVAA